MSTMTKKKKKMMILLSTIEMRMAVARAVVEVVSSFLWLM